MASKRKPTGPSKRELELRKKWQARTEDNSRKTGKAHLAMFDGMLGPAPSSVPVDPDALFCSFCSTRVDPTKATYGKKPRTVYAQKLVTDDETGEVKIEETKLHRQDKVIACPTHALEIKPAISRDTCPNCEGKKIVIRDGIERNCLRCAKFDKKGRLKSTGRVDGSIRSNLYLVSREEM
jgi:hypothetical protein